MHKYGPRTSKKMLPKPENDFKTPKMEFKIYVYFQTPFSGIFRHFLKKNLFR